MTDHAGYCECPVLRAAAEIERLRAMTGVELGEFSDVGTALIIGSLRDRYGCHGPRRLDGCYWQAAMFFRSGLQLSRVREIRRKDEGDVPGEYL